MQVPQVKLSRIRWAIEEICHFGVDSRIETDFNIGRWIGRADQVVVFGRASSNGDARPMEHRLAPNALTPRERDCLRLLSIGLLTSEVKRDLGISQSTLDKHLTSARRKLGVRTTTQAVLRFQVQVKPVGSDAASVNLPRHLVARESAQAIKLLDELSTCRTFAEARKAFHELMSGFGVLSTNFWIVSEANPDLRQVACSFWSTWPDELLDLYTKMGGLAADPTASLIAHQQRPFIVDPEQFYRDWPTWPAAVQKTATALTDSGLNRMLCVPFRDVCTGARMGAVFAFSVGRYGELEELAAALGTELEQSVAVLFDFAQRSRLLAEAVGLTQREREALCLVARGYSIKEITVRLNVSVRSSEKFLANARSKLGARNTSQAVYRAMVYRALG